VHASPTGVADAAPIVFVCLPSGAISEMVAREVVAGSAVRISVEMSTIGGAAQAKVQAIVEARGIALIDCPISGGPKGARAGILTVIAAGPPDARAEIRPWLDAIGKNVFETGDKAGQAQLMKLVINLVNAANIATAFEAMVLGIKGGLDPDQMVNVLNVSTGQNSATLTKVPKAVLTGTFDYGSSLTIMVKDVVLGLKEAEALGVPMWVHGTVGQL
jgi:3-hydroxyisobutyrate dehydrogenase-like beta-hydroxyacid dehydrogenase